MAINPFVLGSGMAAKALEKALAILSLQHPTWDIQKAVHLSRGEKFSIPPRTENPVLVIANPHGLHAAAIAEGEKAGFKAIVVEKPSCVNAKEIELLKPVRLPVAVCHVIRQTWGPQTLKRMLEAGELGDLVSLEGRYWQSSSAKRAIGQSHTPHPWKNDPVLSGGSDTFIDIGVHWVDLTSYLMGENSFKGTAWVGYANAEAPHRDTHVQFNLKFSAGRQAVGSVSKNVHGAGNDFEVHLLGTKQSASWSFQNPDGIWVGKGGSRTFVPRSDNDMGSQQPAFHGMGWLEGYIEIVRQLLLETQGQGGGNYPKLSENLKMMESLFALEKLQ